MSHAVSSIKVVLRGEQWDCAHFYTKLEWSWDVIPKAFCCHVMQPPSECLHYQAWQPLLQCCWAYPCNTSMEYWSFACVGGISKQIYVCVCTLWVGERVAHRHTCTEEGKTYWKPWPTGEKENFINFKHLSSCSALWDQNVPFLICLLLTWGPSAQWNLWLLLLGIPGWAQQQALPRVEHGLRNLHHVKSYRPGSFFFRADGALCYGKGSCQKKILNPAWWSVSSVIPVAPQNSLILYFG